MRIYSICPIKKIHQRKDAHMQLCQLLKRPVLGLLTLFLLGSLTLQAKEPNIVINETSHVKYGDLQNAIDTANPGDTLKVSGIFFGPFTIDKNLTLQGNPKAILDGQYTNRVLTVGESYAGDTPLEVTLRCLEIRHGFATNGGGILNYGDLTVKSCIIISNTTSTDEGGGISSIKIWSLPAAR